MVVEVFRWPTPELLYESGFRLSVEQSQGRFTRFFWVKTSLEGGKGGREGYY